MSKERSATTGYINNGTIAENRKARFEYEILETIEGGMVLMGTEVKALRRGRANISDAYAGEKDGALWLMNSEIGEWEGGNRFKHEPRRYRKILLKRKQEEKLLGQIKQKGMTLVPLKLYFNNRGFAKVLLGIAKGRKDFEKREVQKERDWQRDQQRIMKDKW